MSVTAPRPVHDLQALIEEARRRARRRRHRAAVLVLALVGAVFFLLAPRVGDGTISPVRPPLRTVAPSTVLIEQPWIGTDCPGPHSVAAVKATPAVPLCDRIGLGISLRTRAITATATINGQTFNLDNAKQSDPPVHGRHSYLAGFLQHAAFLKRGPFKTITDKSGTYRLTIDHIHLVIDYGAGRKLQTSLTELGYSAWG